MRMPLEFLLGLADAAAAVRNAVLANIPDNTELKKATLVKSADGLRRATPAETAAPEETGWPCITVEKGVEAPLPGPGQLLTGKSRCGAIRTAV